MEDYNKLFKDIKGNTDEQINNFVYSFGAIVSSSLENTRQDIRTLKDNLTSSISNIELKRFPLRI